ncbi:hypothetical protein TWF730_006464 [Orbilia blumenaviensis]|uniref:Uncharacterized protein n=1 Tax=Orbilia blumenaviensis TaxID=1796055 RepID=A0AAV9VFV3_9PEZI
MLFSKIAVPLAFFVGSSVAIVSNGAPFIAYVCPPGPADQPFVYRNAASTRGIQNECKYVAQDNTNPPRHGVLVNQCPQTMPDTPECTWYAFDQTFDIPANGAPFVFYATKNKGDCDATAVRCRQAGCKWVSKASKVKKAGTMGILCNMCDRSPELTPGADSYGFGNNPPPKDPEPEAERPAPVKQVTVTKTITVGTDPKTIRVIEYVNDDPTRTITEYVEKSVGGPKTITKTIRDGDNTKTIIIEYIGGRPIKTITLGGDRDGGDKTSTVTKYITKDGRRVKTIYIRYINGRADTTKTITVNGPSETKVITRYITEKGRRAKTVYVRIINGVTKTVTETAKAPEPTDDGEDKGKGGDDNDDKGKGGDDNGDDGY